jgi:hypothetical protein
MAWANHLDVDPEFLYENSVRARKEINESDGEGFLADRRGAERPNVLDVHDLFATKRPDKKTSQMAHLFSDEP